MFPSIFAHFCNKVITVLLTVVIKERHETFTEGRDFLHVSVAHGKNNYADDMIA